MQINNSYDVIIIGAGIAGISAAIKAGRMGTKVLLIENLGFLGGMSSAGMVSPFMKHSINGQPLVKGIFEDLENEMQKNNGMIDNGFYANSFRNSSYNLINNSNVTILFNCEILNVNRSEKAITSIDVYVYGQNLNITAKVFIDTSGDALLLYLGRFPYEKGDETTGKLQALTLFFRIGGINMPKALEYVKNNKSDFFDWMDYNFDLNKIISVAGYFSNVKKAIQNDKLSNDVKYLFFTTLPASGEASFNTSNVLGLDGSNSFELTKAEIIGRQQVKQVVDILLGEIPGFEQAYLLETAVQVGVRETRRAVGEYVITGRDIKEGSKFNDVIARGCYGIDIHGQTDEESRMEDLKEGEYYEIPVRSLIVKDAENLLVAGRCISATHEGQSALRIMPTSSATGEACGTLAALAVKENKTVRNIDYKVLKSNLSGNI
ncbi:MAG: FAD-dependent oxidoreductase [bacterium]